MPTEASPSPWKLSRLHVAAAPLTGNCVGASTATGSIATTKRGTEDHPPNGFHHRHHRRAAAAALIGSIVAPLTRNVVHAKPLAAAGPFTPNTKHQQWSHHFFLSLPLNTFPYSQRVADKLAKQSFG